MTARSRRGIAGHVVGLLSAAGLVASVALAQAGAPDNARVVAAGRDSACTVDTLNARFPLRWLGTRVGQITVQARNVETPLALLRPVVDHLHRATRLMVAENELSFAPGDAMDSLAILESVRRLRRTQFYSEVILEGRQCGNGTTDITLWTRDSWSLRLNYRLGQTGGSRAAISEVNLFGTGRTVSAAREEVDGHQASSISLVDPYLFNTRLRGALALRSYADGRAWLWSVRTRELSPRDPWRALFASTQLRRFNDDSAANTRTDILRRTDVLTATRLLFIDRNAAWAAVAGIEHQRANLTIRQATQLLGRADVQRDFTAPLVGLSRRSMRFDAIDWLVPGQSPAEVPVGIEGEAVIAIGNDVDAHARITHFDGWLGGTALLTRGTIITGDVWSSGFWSHDSASNGTVRAAAALYQRANRGLWILRASSERIFDPDPDIFALSTTDPLLRTLAPESRLAESAISVSAERSLHLYASDGRWVLDGALFTTYSERHRTVNGVSGDVLNLQAVTIGIGLRQVRNQPTQAPLRFDIGRAIWRTKGLPDRWIVVLTTTPWINSGRLRDGLREAR